MFKTNIILNLNLNIKKSPADWLGIFSTLIRRSTDPLVLHQYRFASPAVIL